MKPGLTAVTEAVVIHDKGSRGSTNGRWTPLSERFWVPPRAGGLPGFVARERRRRQEVALPLLALFLVGRVTVLIV